VLYCFVLYCVVLHCVVLLNSYIPSIVTNFTMLCDILLHCAGWQVADGRWQVAGGRWQMAGGRTHICCTNVDIFSFAQQA
jgi:hypothetical protein